MPHLITKVTGFEILGDHTLRVRFADDTAQIIDFLPVLAGELFAPLRDKKLFAQVRLDAECHTLVWPNGADFDPATLHDWPKFAIALEVPAKNWQLARAWSGSVPRPRIKAVGLNQIVGILA